MVNDSIECKVKLPCCGICAINYKELQGILQFWSCSCYDFNTCNVQTEKLWVSSTILCRGKIIYVYSETGWIAFEAQQCAGKSKYIFQPFFSLLLRSLIFHSNGWELYRAARSSLQCTQFTRHILCNERSKRVGLSDGSDGLLKNIYFFRFSTSVHRRTLFSLCCSSSSLLTIRHHRV